MSTISSFDDALDFLPKAERSATAGTGLLARLRVLWEAMAEANAAAYRYRELTSRGLTADAAAAKVFTEFYATR